MNYDFATIMAIALVICGIIWAVDALLWAPRRREAVATATQAAGGSLDEETRLRLGREPVLVEYARSFFPVILVVFCLRSFLVEPFRIPSGSMIPTLLTGDFILVNKFDYGIRLPVLNDKILNIGEPHRGDVVVFRYPEDPSTDYIKRVIGLPGDHIAYHDKTVYINGVKAEQRFVGPYTVFPTGIPLPSRLEVESLDDKKHIMVIHPGFYGRLEQGEWTVPPHSYFMMGDNRDNSNDSRAWGFVPEKNLVGKAFLIWMNWNGANGGITWNRLGKAIR
jgi:signal peptidase I